MGHVQPQPANRVIAALLTGILIALLLLVAVVAFSGRRTPAHEPYDTPSVVRDGEQFERSRLPIPPDPPAQPIADPARIQQTLLTGRTYQVQVKAGITARVEDKDWGVRTVTNLVYVGEALITRRIESNDGHRIVELRTFEVCRNTKLLHEVENVELTLGPAGHALLNGLTYVSPGPGSQVVAAKALAEAILGAGAQTVANSRSAKAFARVQGLEGKTVRITYEDGKGVTQVQPVGCFLTGEERDLVFSTAVLSDCALFPDLTIRPGGTWSVDGSQFAGLLDPSLNGRPRGRVTIVRDPDQGPANNPMAHLRIQSGLLVLESSDQQRQRVGTFTPRGKLRYALKHNYVETAELSGELTIDQVSKDHLLFEATFRTQPQMEVVYSCQLLD